MALNNLVFNHIDLRYLIELSGDDREFQVEILQTFLADVPQSMATMRTAINKADWAQLHMSAHKLKSSSGILRATELSSCAAELEHAALHDKHVIMLSNLLDKLTALYAPVKADAELALQQLQTK